MRPNRPKFAIPGACNCSSSRGIHIPGLANVDDIDAVWASLPEVGLHVDLEVLAANVALGGQQHLDVLSSGVERRGEVLGGHLRGCRYVVACRRRDARCVVLVLLR